MPSSPNASVIISTYNNAEALELSLAGYTVQSHQNFEIILADDGSDPVNVGAMKNLIKKFPTLQITHSPIPDDGFRKCRALNKAVSVSRADYLIFTDADIIPRCDFVQNHLALRKPNTFISGGSHLDTDEASLAFLNQTNVTNNQCFTKAFWRSHNALTPKMNDRLQNPPLKAAIKDAFTQRRKAFNGSNASCWKLDFIKVNGFDEDFGYGGLDVDFGLRLSNAGIKSKRYRYSLICLHQWHPRPYKDAAKVKANKAWMRQQHRAGRCFVENGYRNHLT